MVNEDVCVCYERGISVCVFVWLEVYKWTIISPLLGDGAQ